jgi:site-specific DNA-methyltransferase (adenine-specific)
METNKIYQGDCLELMKQIEDKSIDMVLCDLPYGTSGNKWDIKIDKIKLFREYKRIIKDDSSIILTSYEPFTSELIINNLQLFKYKIIWYKVKSSCFFNAKKRPLQCYENTKEAKG